MKIARLALGLLLFVGCEGRPVAPASTTGQTTTGISATTGSTTGKPDVAVTAEQTEEPKDRPTDAELALRRIDRRVAEAKLNSRRRAGWVSADRLATMLLTRARLTGDLGDFVEAGEALELAFERAPEDDGPFFTRAYYNTAVGRTDLVLADLKAERGRKVKREPTEASELFGLLGDGALRSGELKNAREFYQRAVDARNTVESLARVSYFDARIGLRDAATSGYSSAVELAGDDIGKRAWVLVQRGILDLLVDDPESALVWFTKAQSVFSGWYLADEYIANATLLLGKTQEACALYEALASAHPHGRYRAAAARCVGELGDVAERDRWRAEAETAFERDLKRLPGMVAPDAIDFYLEVRPKRALSLAKDAHQRGAGPRASVQLAQAQLANGNAKKARGVLEPLRLQGWTEPDFLATLALAHEGTEEEQVHLSAASPARVVALRKRLLDQ